MYDNIDIYDDGDDTESPEYLENVISDAKRLRFDRLCIQTRESAVVPPSIERLYFLQELVVEAKVNDVRFLLPRDLKRQFTMSNMIVGSLPPSIGRFQNLQKLTLTGTYRLPQQIGNLSNLTVLTLRFSAIPSLPPSIGRLKKLEYLTLSHYWQLKELPQETGNLTALDSLVVRYTNIASLPPTIGGLQNLKLLKLEGNAELSSLPEEIGDLTTLKKLELTASCPIQSFPASLKGLQNLEYLKLQHYCFGGSLLTEIGHSFHPAALTMINLSYSFVQRSLPSSLGKLKGLKHIDLSGCRLQEEKRSPLPSDSVLLLPQYCPLLGSLLLKPPTGKNVLTTVAQQENLDFLLACNRARFRGFARTTTTTTTDITRRSVVAEANKDVLPNMWPCLLFHARRVFSRYSDDEIGECSVSVPLKCRVLNIPTQEDAVYHILTSGSGRKAFLEMLLSRSEHRQGPS